MSAIPMQRTDSSLSIQEEVSRAQMHQFLAGKSQMMSKFREDHGW